MNSATNGYKGQTVKGLERKIEQYSHKVTAYFRITDKSQGGNIGDASVNYYAEDETEAEAIAFYISNYNKHHGTQWELVK
jgi:hypothetical protein